MTSDPPDALHAPAPVLETRELLRLARQGDSPTRIDHAMTLPESEQPQSTGCCR